MRAYTRNVRVIYAAYIRIYSGTSSVRNNRILKIVPEVYRRPGVREISLLRVNDNVKILVPL